MTKTKNGFGVVTLIVIIAIVLIVGGYMYYQNQSATPADTSTPAAANDAAAVNAAIPAGTMETGTAYPAAQ